MQNFKAYGVVDYLPNLKKLKNKIENILIDNFEKCGYSEAEPPILTPYSLYKKQIGAVEDSGLFKIQDTDGSLLVLRNDITMPISRMVAEAFDEKNPLRICYKGSSFALSGEINRLREFSQVGIELYNADTPFGDAEVIALAIKSLILCGIKDFQIDIGQVGIIKSILKNTNLDKEETEEIITLIDKKNFISESVYKSIDRETVVTLNKITALYGGKEVLEKAKNLLKNEESLKSLEELVTVYNLLEGLGLEKYISFDLGLVNSFSYYSGIVFKGITGYFGAPILGGGRYDKLMNNFNKDMRATGFAIGVNDAIKALQKQGEKFPNEDKIVSISIDNEQDSFIKAHLLKEKYIKDGYKVEILFDLDEKADVKVKKGEVV